MIKNICLLISIFEYRDSSGDTLWSIAEDNMDARYYRHTADYVAEVKRMNSLDTDQIIAGSYLIIPYYSTEFVGSTD